MQYVSAVGFWVPLGTLLAFLKLSSSVQAPTSDQGTQVWMLTLAVPKPKGKQHAAIPAPRDRGVRVGSECPTNPKHQGRAAP